MELLTLKHRTVEEDKSLNNRTVGAEGWHCCRKEKAELLAQKITLFKETNETLKKNDISGWPPTMTA